MLPQEQAIINDDEEVPPEDELVAIPGCLTRHERLKQEAASWYHQMLHSPKNPFCKGCNSGKAQRVRRVRKTKKKKSEEEKEPKVFCEELRMDPVMESDPRLQRLGCGGMKMKGALFCTVEARR